MGLRRFLDTAYAILVDEYRKLGVNLIEALEKLNEYEAGRKNGHRVIDTQNEASFAELQSMMSAVGGMPG